MLGLLFIFSSSNEDHGSTAQIVPSSSMDSHSSDAVHP